MLRNTLLACVLWVLAASVAVAQDWTGVDTMVGSSVQRVESAVGLQAQGLCSSGVINAKEHYVLTAAHCVPTITESRSMTVGGLDAQVVKVNYLLDLAVLKVAGLKGEQLELREDAAPVGTPVAIVGFAFGAQRPKYTFGHVSDTEDPSLAAAGSLERGQYLDVMVIGGHSGGVVIDQEGRLVGTAQAILYSGVSHLAIAAQIPTVRSFVEEFLPPVKRPESVKRVARR